MKVWGNQLVFAECDAEVFVQLLAPWRLMTWAGGYHVYLVKTRTLDRIQLFLFSLILNHNLI